MELITRVVNNRVGTVKISVIAGFYLIFVFLILFPLPMLAGSLAQQPSVEALITFAANWLISSAMLLREIKRKAYSINMIHWIFILFFFVFAGFSQYVNGGGLFPYGVRFSDTDVVHINLIVLLWIVVYCLGTLLPFKRKIHLFSTPIKNNRKFLNLITLVSVIIFFYIVHRDGISVLLSRETAGVAFYQGSGTVTMLSESILRNFIVYSCAISILYVQNNKRGLGNFIILICCCLIVNFPLALPRFDTATIYMGFLLLIFRKSWRKGIKFAPMFILAFMFLFPVLNVFRRHTLQSVNTNIILQSASGIYNDYLSGHYDAYTMIYYAVTYVNSHGLTMGKQLLSSILFFIPHTMWVGKSLSSGQLVAEAYHVAYTNISFPLVSEGIINFGLLGVVLFAFIFGRIIATLDKAYWKSVERDELPNYLYIIYPFLISLVFYMSRGDLMSTFAYTAGHVVIFSTLFWLNNRVLLSVKEAGGDLAYGIPT